MQEIHQIRFDCPCLIFFKLNIFIQKDEPNKFNVKKRVDVRHFVDITLIRMVASWVRCVLQFVCFLSLFPLSGDCSQF